MDRADLLDGFPVPPPDRRLPDHAQRRADLLTAVRVTGRADRRPARHRRLVPLAAAAAVLAILVPLSLAGSHLLRSTRRQRTRKRHPPRGQRVPDIRPRPGVLLPGRVAPHGHADGRRPAPQPDRQRRHGGYHHQRHQRQHGFGHRAGLLPRYPAPVG
jgi:hypothetical protein